MLRYELDGSVSALRRAIAEVKQRWSVIGWVTKNLLSRTPSCFEATLDFGTWMGDQKFITSSSSVLRKARSAVGPGCICSG
jgi:P2-related tail formation protein